MRLLKTAGIRMKDEGGKLNSDINSSFILPPSSLFQRPLFLADWLDALFIHFEVPAEILQKQTPFTLHLKDGKAYVSLVAFTQRNLRPTFGGEIARWLSAPLAGHEFLNIRTYVRVNGEPGIHFLAEYIPNRLATLIGPKLYGLPYRLGTLSYTLDTHHRFYDGVIQSKGRLSFNGKIPLPPTAPAPPGTLDEFLIERYSAFTNLGRTVRRFRIRHEPWLCTRADVTLDETTLLETSGEWFKHARFIGASYSPGLRNVEIGKPERSGSMLLKQQGRASPLEKWGPIVVLPIFALAARDALPAWGFMWALCFAIFFACKWVTLFDAKRAGAVGSVGRTIGYLFAWVGMDAPAFLARDARVVPPAPRQWLRAAFKMLAGVALIWIVAPMVLPRYPLLGGWTGLVGMVLMLHVGAFDLLTLAWQRAGVNAVPIMDHTIRATSVADFWGNRWNRGFHDLAMRYVFRPLHKKTGVMRAMLATFLASGVIHDAVISLPAGAGYGLATAYFLIQGLALLAERMPRLRRIFQSHPWLARVYVVACTLGPVGLLLHPPFVRNVIVPFMNVIGAT